MSAHSLSLGAFWRTLAWLIRDTFRQSCASGIFWVLLGVSLLAIGVCASASIVGDKPLAAPGEEPDFLPRRDPQAHDAERLQSSGVVAVDGHLQLAFGAIRIPITRNARSSVHFLELVLAGGVADTLGLLLTLVWTAGFLPSFLDSRAVAVLLAKPIPRWLLLTGKYLGVLTFVLANATLFVVGTWVALGLRTGIWDSSYLFAIPLLLLHFAMFFSVSALLAVFTQSTVLCVFGSILFWAISWSINFGRHALLAATDTLGDGSFSSGFAWLSDTIYWLLPKPADVSLLLFKVLDAHGHFAGALDLDTLTAHGFSFTLSILSSLAFTLLVLMGAARKLALTDY